MVTEAQIGHWKTLQPNDIERLHLVLYAGDWPLPQWLVDQRRAVFPAHRLGDVTIPAMRNSAMELHGAWEIRVINRLRKTGWIAIAKGRMFLTQAGLEAAPVWLNYTWAQTAKREVKGFFSRTLLKHRIPWGQIDNLWLRGEPLKTPLERWFDPSSPIL